MSEVESTSAATLNFPAELLVMVSEFLAGDLCFGTIANLNAASWTVHQETLPVLYETMIWDYRKHFQPKLLQEGVGAESGWKYVKYFVVEAVPQKPKSALDHLPYEAQLPRIKMVLHKPKHFEVRDYDWAAWTDIWRRCSLIVFKPVCFHVLDDVVKSSASSRAFFSNEEIRYLTMEKWNHNPGDYVPERIGTLILKGDGALLFQTRRTTSAVSATRYGYLLDLHLLRTTLNISGEERDCVRAMRNVIVWTEDSHGPSLNHQLQCHTSQLPIVMQAVAGIESRSGDMEVSLKDRTTLTEFIYGLAEAVTAYLTARRAVYSDIFQEERRVQQAFRRLTADWLSAPNWEDPGLFDDADPMLCIYPKIEEEDDSVDDDGTSGATGNAGDDHADFAGEESASQVSSDDIDPDDSQEDDSETDDNGYAGYMVTLYNANVQPTASSRGQTNVFAELERQLPGGDGEEVLFRQLYRESS
ncbi:hypothetical protein QFC20_007237 [Naganishia adeliensis]|uniref:Uncharacterized protein n=1 Tax=Naganishia adeliensis TaxID=92952 RepID=A0ACC2V1T8_9TREE|nr:hypothetical protein QFC20_007237 [Naganishia adeliensis]